MFHPLHLDYHRPPLPLPAARRGWMLLGVGVLALAACLGYGWRLGEQVAAAEVQVQALAHAPGTAAPQARRALQPSQAEFAQVGRANAVLRSLNVPWEDLFRAVEASANGDVALLQLQPDAQKGTVRITAEATDYAALVAYAGELSRHEPIAAVMLQSHEQDARSRSLRFTLVARWRGNGS